MNNLEFGTMVRESLCKNGFYSVDKLERLMNILLFTKGMTNNISTFDTDMNTMSIRLQLRKAYMNKNDVGYDSIDYYNDDNIKSAMAEFYSEYKADIASMIPPEHLARFYQDAQASMFYYITRYGENTVMISFV